VFHDDDHGGGAGGDDNDSRFEVLTAVQHPRRLESSMISRMGYS
jgi:hypothetical protein